MKKIICLLLSMALIFPTFASASPTSVSISDENQPRYVNEKDIQIVSPEELTGTQLQLSSPKIKPLGQINDFYYRKSNVTYSTEWSPYKRVSDNIIVGPAGGSIAVTKTVSFGTEISGEVYGINIATNASLESSIGYTLNASPNSRVYVGYRVLYQVERGTREYCDGIVNPRVISKNPYTVKTPQYGEYVLITY